MTIGNVAEKIKTSKMAMGKKCLRENIFISSFEH